MTLLLDCRCTCPPREGVEPSLSDFGAIRDDCGALRQVLLPDEVWPRFEKWHHKPDDVAWHRSAVFLAFQRGHLGQLTSPVHRYLIAHGSVRPDVRQQYRQDLCERWMYYDDPVERHRKWRIFCGRVAELQCAQWLEGRGWAITGLEAIREGCDIEATSPDGSTTAIEVKYIGTEDADFSAIVSSIAGASGARFSSAYSGVNYLLVGVSP